VPRKKKKTPLERLHCIRIGDYAYEQLLELVAMRRGRVGRTQRAEVERAIEWAWRRRNKPKETT